ncbi:hypothetical protein RAS2_28340 [Phycisphaerae bacterium RAS2]|nr:hypothetical protein RAS2_28340 [Phycisphaerae bacterium RAS2]
MMTLRVRQRENIATMFALRSRATPPRRDFLPETVAAVHVASGRRRLRGRRQKSSRVSIASQARSWQNPPRARIVPASRLHVSTDARPPAQSAESPLGRAKFHPEWPECYQTSASRDSVSPGPLRQSISPVLLGLDVSGILIIDPLRGQDHGRAGKRQLRCHRFSASYAVERRARDRSFRHVTCKTDSGHRPERPREKVARSRGSEACFGCTDVGYSSSMRVEARWRNPWGRCAGIRKSSINPRMPLRCASGGCDRSDTPANQEERYI